MLWETLTRQASEKKLFIPELFLFKMINKKSIRYSEQSQQHKTCLSTKYYINRRRKIFVVEGLDILWVSLILCSHNVYMLDGQWKKIINKYFWSWNKNRKKSISGYVNQKRQSYQTYLPNTSQRSQIWAFEGVSLKIIIKKYKKFTSKRKWQKSYVALTNLFFSNLD